MTNKNKKRRASSSPERDEKQKEKPLASVASPVPKVSFKTFRSPNKSGANPYNISFILVKGMLVGFYFTRAKFGTNKTYANHLMRQSILKGESWVAPLNVSEDEFFFHIDGVAQKHFPGCQYNKRLFLLEGAYDFDSTEEFTAFVRPLAGVIAREMNKRLNVDSQLSVPLKDEDLVQVLEDGVFADVAGKDAACEKLVSVLGEDYDPTEFEDNKELIYSFFRPGTIPNHIGKLLGCSASDMQAEPIYNS